MTLPKNNPTDHREIKGYFQVDGSLWAIIWDVCDTAGHPLPPKSSKYYVEFYSLLMRIYKKGNPPFELTGKQGLWKCVDQNYLAEANFCSVSTVGRYLRFLHKVGLIKYIKHGYTHKKYLQVINPNDAYQQAVENGETYSKKDDSVSYPLKRQKDRINETPVERMNLSIGTQNSMDNAVKVTESSKDGTPLTESKQSGWKNPFGQVERIENVKLKESNTIQTKEPLLNNVNKAKNDKNHFSNSIIEKEVTVEKWKQPELRSINSKKDNSRVDVPSKLKRMTDEELARRRDQVLTAYRKNKSTKVQPSVIDEEDDPYWPPRPMNHS